MTRRQVSQRLKLAITVVVLTIGCGRTAAASSLTLAWDPATDGITAGYSLYYGNASGFYSEQVDVGLTTIYTVNGLGEGLTYFFAVRAYDAVGNMSDYSNEVYASTASSTPPVVTAVTLSSSVPPPQIVGTSVTWLATAAGGVAPYEFQWASYDGTSWTASPWTTSSTWTWTPAAAGDYEISVAVRSAGSTSATGELSQTVPFTINAVAPPPPTVTTLTLTSDLSSPQFLGTTVTWLATASGGITPYQYQWSVGLAGVWTTLPWTSASTWLWVPSTAGDYEVRVAVRSADSTSANGELTQSAAFTVTAPNCFFKSDGKCVHLP